MSSTHELADRLHSAAIHLLRRVRKSDVATGVTPAPLSALSVLMSGPKTLRGLAAAEQGKPPTGTPLPRELERLGLAKRETDQTEAPLARVSSAAHGRA